MNKNKNIENLISLWRLVGQIGGDHLITDRYELSAVTLSEWPNRIWFNGYIDTELLEHLSNNYKLKDFTFPLMGESSVHNEKIFRKAEFDLKSLQYGMLKQLEGINLADDRVKVVKVTEPNQAYIWSNLFEASFGYMIHPDTVALTMKVVDYYIATYEDQPVGTAVLFFSNSDIAGIHSMGIIPEMRKNGFARSLLLQTLKIAEDKGANWATLQASDSGRPLYKQVGFKEEFIIKNYIKS
ncbi:GNAT family N-acetyltransferase [Marivirga arenosa]|uniref:GNAT family N-acetyltransferase n=1 Tax=Marivirga arenosa TaxID=3059076 RepID=A0AA49GGS3_9BACT|nr:GNAT family N-acetyltransferase [Marivirga sp. BKB1-2]WKK81043.2 GNAT family N-acetyltransferase [Marivirga sp. BKB1-2]